MNNKAAIYVIEMCTKMVDHYTKVIDSCETISQLEIANRWSLDGFKNLRSVAENLPRRRRKLCLSALEVAHSFVCNTSLSKSLDLTFQKLNEIIPFPSRFQKASEKTLEDLLEALKKSGAKGVIVKVERVQKTDPEAPGDGQSADKEDPEGSK